MRIALKGIDEALRTLSRVPDWAANYEDRADASELLKRANALRETLERHLRTGLPAEVGRRGSGSVGGSRTRAKRVRNIWQEKFGGRE